MESPCGPCPLNINSGRRCQIRHSTFSPAFSSLLFLSLPLLFFKLTCPTCAALEGFRLLHYVLVTLPSSRLPNAFSSRVKSEELKTEKRVACDRQRDLRTRFTLPHSLQIRALGESRKSKVESPGCNNPEPRSLRLPGPRATESALLTRPTIPRICFRIDFLRSLRVVSRAPGFPLLATPAHIRGTPLADTITITISFPFSFAFLPRYKASCEARITVES